MTKHTDYHLRRPGGLAVVARVPRRAIRGRSLKTPHTSDERVSFDFYETPPNVTRAFARLIERHLRGRRVLEPCVGDAAIANVLRTEFDCRVVTNDIDPKRQAYTHIDAGDAALYRVQTWPPQVVISNPPFNVAGTIVAQAVEHAEDFTAMLLRLSFMEPVADRRDFLVAHPPQHRIVTERISFRKSAAGSSTDSITTEWVIWTRDRQPLDGVPAHGVLLWKHL